MALRCKPRKRSRTPRYPTRREVLARPELLEMNEPPAWLGRAELAGAVSVFLAANGCAAVLGERAPRPPAPRPAVAVVAPIFEHGDGLGAFGCVVVTPPAFLSEEEALEVIKLELARAGVALSDRGAPVPELNVHRRRWVEEARRMEWEDVPLELDRLDPERHIAVEYVSADDDDKLGDAPGRTSKGENGREVEEIVVSSVTEYDQIALAEKIRGAAAQGHGYWAGVFYDPMSPVDVKDVAEDDAREMRAARDALERLSREEWQRDLETNGPAHRRLDAARRGIERSGRERSKKLLKKQVQDFVDWLRAQGAI